MDSKEGKSIRPIGQPVAEYPDERCGIAVGTYVFPGQGRSHAFGSFPNPWEQIFKDTPVIRSRKSISRHDMWNSSLQPRYQGPSGSLQGSQSPALCRASGACSRPA